MLVNVIYVGKCERGFIAKSGIAAADARSDIRPMVFQWSNFLF